VCKVTLVYGQLAAYYIQISWNRIFRDAFCNEKTSVYAFSNQKLTPNIRLNAFSTKELMPNKRIMHLAAKR